MKRGIALALCALLLCAAIIPTASASEIVITGQPQSPLYPEGSMATYSVEVYGDDLRFEWNIVYEGTRYKIDDADGTMPWEAYAGAYYGVNPSGDTLFFNGIGAGLDGAEVYCTIYGASGSLDTMRAVVRVGGSQMPPEVTVPNAIIVKQNEELTLECGATALYGGELQYLWYRTDSMDLYGIIAVNRGTETERFLKVDTSVPGYYYYVCGVNEVGGGDVYSSIISVWVQEAPAVDPPEILTKDLPEGMVGEDYTAQLKATDSKAEFVIYQDPGKPNEFGKTGLKLSPSGKIYGTPKAAGTYTFAVCAAGAGGEGYWVYTLTIKDVPATEETKPSEEPTEATETATEEEPQEQMVTSSQAPEETQATTEPVVEEGQSGKFAWWWIIVLAVCIAAGTAVVILVLSKKKK